MGHTINICKEHGRPQITCWDCKDAEITALRARIAELEERVKAKDQEVVDVLNNAERYYADFRARIAELEVWKADSLLRWQQAVTLGGQQLERIAELERERKALRGTLSINAPEALKALDQVFESPELLGAFTHAMKPTT